MTNPKQQLTNEILNNRYANSFKLVNEAIGIAHTLIGSGKIPRISPEIYNQAYQILHMIAEEKNIMEAVDLDRVEEEDEADVISSDLI